MYKGSRYTEDDQLGKVNISFLSELLAERYGRCWSGREKYNGRLISLRNLVKS